MIINGFKRRYGRRGFRDLEFALTAYDLRIEYCGTDGLIAESGRETASQLSVISIKGWPKL